MIALRPIIRSLRVNEWPLADRLAWEAAGRPSLRLMRGGTASHLRQVTRDDLAKRYGLYLNFVQRTQGTDAEGLGPASSVSSDLVAKYIEELRGRVSSVTLYGNIYKLRRTAELLAPNRDFAWLREIEQDLNWEMRPAAKFDRIVDSDCLIAAGLALMEEAQNARGEISLNRARAYRNGLMVALLAFAPIRLKNFASLAIGQTLIGVKGRWLISLPSHETKSGRPDERPLPKLLTDYIDRFIHVYRPVLGTSEPRIWIGANGRALSYASCERIITETTRRTIGIAVNPHLFRCCAASTLALHAGDKPNLASALLQHTDPRVTERNYNRARSASHSRAFSSLIDEI